MVSGFLELEPLPTARAAAEKTRQELDDLLSDKIPKYTSEDTSLVVFGSLARGEWTSASEFGLDLFDRWSGQFRSFGNRAEY